MCLWRNWLGYSWHKVTYTTKRTEAGSCIDARSRIQEGVKVTYTDRSWGFYVRFYGITTNDSIISYIYTMVYWHQYIRFHYTIPYYTKWQHNVERHTYTGDWGKKASSCAAMQRYTKNKKLCSQLYRILLHTTLGTLEQWWTLSQLVKFCRHSRSIHTIITTLCCTIVM